jgi:hypothetical protein
MPADSVAKKYSKIGQPEDIHAAFWSNFKKICRYSSPKTNKTFTLVFSVDADRWTNKAATLAKQVHFIKERLKLFSFATMVQVCVVHEPAQYIDLVLYGNTVLNRTSLAPDTRRRMDARVLEFLEVSSGG